MSTVSKLNQSYMVKIAVHDVASQPSERRLTTMPMLVPKFIPTVGEKYENLDPRQGRGMKMYSHGNIGMSLVYE